MSSNRRLPDWKLATVAALGALSTSLLGCANEISGPPGSGAGAATSNGGSAAGTPPGTGGTAGTSTGGTSGSSGTAGSSGDGGSGGTGDPTDPTDPTLYLPFARLTRAEYKATLDAALGVQADLAEIPEDGRIGRFTSNVGVFPDPVQPYLFSAEAITTSLIPTRLPACGGATAATCLETNYRAPLERLYRRPLTTAEMASLASLVTNLEAGSATPAEATRAALVSALVSPDFLYRATPIGGDPTRARRLAEQLSYTLWDAPPDADLSAAVSNATPAELGQRLRDQAARLSTNARAVPVLARFLAQWLRMDLDIRLAENYAASPLYAELIAFVENALATNQRVTTFVNGTVGFVAQSNAMLYGLTSLPSSAAVVQVTWPQTSPRRGLVSQETIAEASRHPNATRSPIFRGLMVRNSLLCETIDPPPADVVDVIDEVEDRLADDRCKGCHMAMEPIGRAFGVLDPGGMPVDAVIEEPAELAGTYTTLPALLDAIAGSDAFANCFARNLLGFFLEEAPDHVNSVSAAEVAAVVKAGGGFGDVLSQAVASLETHSQTAIPWCSGS